MTNPQPTSAVEAQGAAMCSLKVNGKALPFQVEIYSILVSKEVNRIPFAKLQIADGDAATRRFGFSESEWFVPGNELEVFLGYPGNLKKVFKGIIIRQELIIRTNTSILEVDCRDTAYRMTLQQRGRYFENLTDADLARQLFRSYGIDAQINKTTFQHDSIVQYDCTDWDLLISRMEFNGCLTILDDGIAYIQAPDFQQEAYPIRFGDNVLEFDGGLEIRDQFKEVIVRSWSPDDQTVVEKKAKDQQESAIRQNGNLPGIEMAAINKQDSITWRHGGNLQDGELQAWANGRLIKDRLSRTCGRVLTKGDHALKPGQIAQLSGFGNRYNGPVYVAAVHHEYTNTGWHTEIEFGLSPKWFSEIVKTTTLPASGMLPAIPGLQIGLVSQIDQDPEGAHRILVRLPVLDEKAAGVWARVATLDAGTGRGTFFRPEIDDEVIVGFIHDDPRDAVILGMLHSREKGAPFTAGSDNHEKGYVSREGIQLVMHEKDGAITLKTPGGNSLILSDKGNGMVLSDKNGNKLELNEQGITLTSASDIKIDAKNKCATMAGSEWKVQSNGTIKLNAKKTTEIKGNPVNIN